MVADELKILRAGVVHCSKIMILYLRGRFFLDLQDAANCGSVSAHFDRSTAVCFVLTISDFLHTRPITCYNSD